MLWLCFKLNSCSSSTGWIQKKKKSIPNITWHVLSNLQYWTLVAGTEPDNCIVTGFYGDRVLMFSILLSYTLRPANTAATSVCIETLISLRPAKCWIRFILLSHTQTLCLQLRRLLSWPLTYTLRGGYLRSSQNGQASQWAMGCCCQADKFIEPTVCDATMSWLCCFCV